ncbi:GGDEF domain-containing protein [bacterium]|nr:MAG: GGDEF domain-containing protein [bacterium]
MSQPSPDARRVIKPPQSPKRPLKRPPSARARERHGRDFRRPQWLEPVLELLRDHPIFEIPDPETGELTEHASILLPSEREREWKRETLRIFRRRTALITVAGILSLIPFWLLFTSMAPQARGSISFAHALMFGCCAILNVLVRRSKSLSLTRTLTIITYAVFGLCAAGVIAAAKDPRVTALSGHEATIISLLFLPFSLAEAFFCAAIVVLSFGLGLIAALSGAESAVTFSDVWPRFAALTITSILVAIMTYLQGLVRRQAFDSAFDMALSASRSAALSNLDAVTGGFNRRHLENMLELELARANRFGQPLSLLMFDLDNFKRVNDQNGHIAGDEVLREVLSSTTEALRGIDTIARYGGDEFIVILPGTSLRAATGAAYRMRALILTGLRDRFPAGSLESLVTISLGVTCLMPGDVVSVERAIERADQQLYEAKRAGKDRIYAE